MLATVLIGAVISFYAGSVVYKKCKQWRAGQYCSCGCSGCTGQSVCGKKHNV